MNQRWAARNSSYAIIRLMHKASGRPIDPILPYAMVRRDDRVRVMTFLLDIGANIDAAEDDFTSPGMFHWGSAINFASCSEGDEELEILLGRGARVDIPAFHGKTCLEIAKDAGMDRKVELIEAYIERNKNASKSL